MAVSAQLFGNILKSENKKLAMDNDLANTVVDHDDTESIASVTRHMTVDTRTLHQTQMILHKLLPFNHNVPSNKQKAKPFLVLVSIDDSGQYLHIGSNSYELCRISSVSLGDCNYQQQFHCDIDIDCVFCIHYQQSDDSDNIQDIVLETDSLLQRDLWAYNIVQLSMKSKDLKHAKQDAAESSDEI